MVMLRLWLSNGGNRATGNELEKALRAIGRDDIVEQAMINVERVTDEREVSLAQMQMRPMDESGFGALKVGKEEYNKVFLPVFLMNTYNIAKFETPLYVVLRFLFFLKCLGFVGKIMCFFTKKECSNLNIYSRDISSL